MHSPIGFHFATAAALINQEGYTGEETEHLLREWERYARYAMMSGKTPASTAEHLARFERYQQGVSLQRDPASRRVQSPNRRMRRVSSVDMDAVIADDLRRRATIIYDDDPEHAQEIFALARRIQHERDVNIGSAADLIQRSRTERDLNRESRCKRGTEIVSLIFPSDFTERAVRAWTKRHGFSSSALEFPRTTGSIRAPQRQTNDFKQGSFRTILLSARDNILAVIGCPRAGRENDKRRNRRDPSDEDDDGFRCSMCKTLLGGFSIMTPDGRAVCSRRCKEAGLALQPGDPFATTEPGLRRSSGAAPSRPTNRRSRKL